MNHDIANSKNVWKKDFNFILTFLTAEITSGPCLVSVIIHNSVYRTECPNFYKSGCASSPSIFRSVPAGFKTGA